jgi:hypothetical protein
MQVGRLRGIGAGLLTLGLVAAGLSACSSSNSSTPDGSTGTGGAGGGPASTGGESGTAGSSGTAGHAGAGGAGGAGGTNGTGGHTATGGANGGGGANGAGGHIGTGGTPGTGGNGAGGAPGTGGATGAGGVTGGGGSTLPATDEFNGSALDSSWTVFNPNLVQVSEGGGTLKLQAVGDSFWYQGNQGVLVYKLVNGDFKATTTVHVSKASNTAIAPDQSIELAGLMARNPTSAMENYVLIVLGLAEMGHIAVENKETTNDVSVFSETAWPVDAELRICRVGSQFTLLRRMVGTTAWTVDTQTTRTDLPATLQVGPNLYDHRLTPDLLAAFDRFAFEPVGAGCTQ